MNKSCSGLTLLEVLVALAIIAIVSIAIPGFLFSMHQQGPTHAANKLRADLQRARVLAVKQKKVCTVLFNHPGVNQYGTTLNKRIADLAAYKGSVSFLSHGPDGGVMAAEVAFNRKGMSTTVVPGNIYITDQGHTSIYRVSVMPPGGILVHRWNGRNWQ